MSLVLDMFNGEVSIDHPEISNFFVIRLQVGGPKWRCALGIITVSMIKIVNVAEVSEGEGIVEEKELNSGKYVHQKHELMGRYLSINNGIWEEAIRHSSEGSYKQDSVKKENNQERRLRE